MRISANPDGTASAFVKMKCGKMLVIDGKTSGDAIHQAVYAIAEHCTITGEHPKNIISEITYE